jgi:hypothetical protein
LQEIRGILSQIPQDAVPNQKKEENLVVFLMSNAVVSGRKL